MNVHTLLVVLAWIGDFGSLYGAYLITKRQRAAFLLFAGADVLLMGVQFEHLVWNQIALFACFTVLNIRGWLTWK